MMYKSAMYLWAMYLGASDTCKLLSDAYSFKDRTAMWTKHNIMTNYLSYSQLQSLMLKMTYWTTTITIVNLIQRTDPSTSQCSPALSGVHKKLNTRCKFSLKDSPSRYIRWNKSLSLLQSRCALYDITFIHPITPGLLQYLYPTTISLTILNKTILKLCWR